MQPQRNSSAPLNSAIIDLTTTNSSDGSILAQYLNLRDKLVQREQSLETELEAIHSALKDFARCKVAPGPMLPPPATMLSAPKRRTGLSAAVSAVLAGGPRTKEQILEALRAQGFPLPENGLIPLNAIMYTPRYRHEGKLFSLAVKTA
jgi:hypothetical protein